MPPYQADQTDRVVRELCENHRYDQATAIIVETLGAELLGFLCAMHHNSDDGADAFSDCCLQIWRGLPSFSWQCSIRTWVYVIARNCGRRVLRDEMRRLRHLAPLDDQPCIDKLAARVRTETLSLLRSRTDGGLTALRQALPEQDQTLLILRVDRELPWSDLAKVFLNDENASEELISKESSRLRKRFQLIRQRLLLLARERGMLRNDAR